MAIKVELLPDTLDSARRRPGYALLRLSGWKLAPNDSVLAVQRNQDGKFLGLNGQWQPTPIWHPLAGMSFDKNGGLQGDVSPALVDPLVAEPNVVYRVEIKGDGAKEQGVVRIASGVLASSATGEGARLTETGEGFIATDLPENEPKTKVATKPVPKPESMPEPAAEPESEIEPEFKSDDNPPGVDLTDEPEEPVIRPRRRWPLMIAMTLIPVLLGSAGLAWWLGWLPGSENGIVASAPGPEPTDEKLTDLELLQRFLKTNPTPEKILAQAEAWEKEQHCDAMRRLMIHGAQKNSYAPVAFAYAQKYDPKTFQGGGCITEADADSAAYWYEIPANAGDVEAQYRLGRLLTEIYQSGYQYEQGVASLQKAAVAGNQNAERWLLKLGRSKGK